MNARKARALDVAAAIVLANLPGKQTNDQIATEVMRVADLLVPYVTAVGPQPVTRPVAGPGVPS